jgi:hypothetical protein
VIAVAGFIARQEQFVDEIGFVTTRTVAKKSKRKQDRNGKVVAQSTRDITWKFVEKSKHTALYRDYFNLSLPVECKMMTLSSQASTPLLRGHLSVWARCPIFMIAWTQSLTALFRLQGSNASPSEPSSTCSSSTSQLAFDLLHYSPRPPSRVA